MTPSCLTHFVLWVFSFRSHTGSPAAPVLPGPHSSNYKGEGLPSLSLDPTSEGASPLQSVYALLTAVSLSQVLDQWFESEPLKATLATDAVIGAMTSPHTPGSG